MTWFKIDDQLHSHPKVLALLDGPCPGDALGLWVLAGSWSASQLTDGLVSPSAVRRLGFGLEAAAELVRVGLWERTEEGFRFHDWIACNPSRADVEAKRTATRERVRSHREKRNAVRNALPPPGNPVTTQPVTPPPTRPDPTRPDPLPPNPPRLGPEPAPGPALRLVGDDDERTVDDVVEGETRLAMLSRLAMRCAVERVGGIYMRTDRAEHVAVGREIAAWAAARSLDAGDVASAWALEWVDQARTRSAASWARYVADRVAGTPWAPVRVRDRAPPGSGEGFDEGEYEEVPRGG